MYFDQVAFGERLRQLRVENNYSQEEMAEELGVSMTHYKHMEYGSKGCSVDLLLILAEMFHVSTDYLLVGTSIERTEEVAQIKAVIETLNQLIRTA